MWWVVAGYDETRVRKRDVNERVVPVHPEAVTAAV